MVIDNAGFHSTKNMELPDNIFLLRIPPYNPELNPCEQVWQYINNRFKNQRFETMDNLREWLHYTVNQMQEQTKTVAREIHIKKVNFYRLNI